MRTNGQLLLIRHAETDAAGTFCGQSDPPVNDRGLAQIEKLVADLMSYRIDVVYSSDLQRALTTAEAIASRFAVPLRDSCNLREIDFGDWEGTTWEQNELRDPIFAQRWLDEFPSLAAPNGEEFQVFEERVLKEFDALAASGQSAAVVTHAGVLRVILTRRCGVSDEQAWTKSKTYCGLFLYPDGASQRYA